MDKGGADGRGGDEKKELENTQSRNREDKEKRESLINRHLQIKQSILKTSRKRSCFVE